MKIRGVRGKEKKVCNQDRSTKQIGKAALYEAKTHIDARTKDVFKSHAGGHKIFGWE